jgi:hypothetical protein
VDGAWTFDGLLQQRGARDVGGKQRRHQVRSAAVVLLGRVGGVLVAVLVGGDRLVLDAVVGRQLAAAQREEGGQQRDRRSGGLAADAARAPTQDGPGDGSAGHHADGPHVLERQPRLGQRALDQGDHGHRLGQADHATRAGQLRHRPAQVRLGAGCDADRAVLRADGRRPVRRPVDD